MSVPTWRLALTLLILLYVIETVLLGSANAHKVSRSYRMWYERLVYAVRVAMPPDSPYSVVHTENLVGLFSCIFIRNSERASLRDMAITTVKRGMGGHYGNKVRPRGIMTHGRGLTFVFALRARLSLVLSSMIRLSASSTAIWLLAKATSLQGTTMSLPSSKRNPFSRRL